MRCSPSFDLSCLFSDMKLLKFGDGISRFRVSQSCVGLAGSLCVIYAVWTPFWLKDQGLWTTWNDTETEMSNNKDIFNGEQLFASDSRIATGFS